MKNKHIMYSTILLVLVVIFEAMLIQIKLSHIDNKLDTISQKLDTLEPYQITIIKEVPVYPSEMPIVEEEETDIANLYSVEISYLSKTVWGEARGCSKTQQAAVVWCILNRVDDERWPNNIVDVVTQKWQFVGYSEDYPVEDDIKELVIDVLTRWEKEKNGSTDVGRILPKEYQFFYGDGNINHFTRKSGGTVEWDWSWGSVY